MYASWWLLGTGYVTASVLTYGWRLADFWFWFPSLQTDERWRRLRRRSIHLAVFGPIGLLALALARASNDEEPWPTNGLLYRRPQ